MQKRYLMTKLPDDIIQQRAVLSDCGLYRYWLSREVSPASPFKPIIFIMLNPSTANADNDDPTIRRCINYTKYWGGSHLVVVNLFAYRSTQPCNLWHEDTVDPVGALNDQAISIASNYAYTHSGIIVAAWGDHGALMSRNKQVLRVIAKYNPMCLKINKTGNPAHPLYQSKKAKLIPVTCR